MSQGLRLLLGKISLFTSGGLEHLIDQIFAADQRVEDTHIPLAILATRIPSGIPELFRSGSMKSALLASTAIPGAFAPVKIAGISYVDGSVNTAVPLMPALQMGAQSLVVFDAGPPCGADTDSPSSLGRLLSDVVAMGTRQRIATNLPRVAKEHRVVYIAAPCDLQASAFDFSRTRKRIEDGRTAALNLLAAGWSDGVGLIGKPHFHDTIDG